MNIVALTGRLTREPEVKRVGQDKDLAQARFTLAVDDYKSTDFINIRCLGKQAEWVEKWTGKGTKVEITGKIKAGSYQDQDGRKVYYTEVLANSVSFGESKAEAEARQQAAGQQEQQGSRQADTAGDDGFMNIPDGIDEELPFS